MSNKKEVVIKLTEEQRAQIKSATGKELTELKVRKILKVPPPTPKFSDDRSLLGAVLDDRY